MARRSPVHARSGAFYRPRRKTFADYFIPQWSTYRQNGEMLLYMERRHIIDLMLKSWEGVGVASLSIGGLIAVGDKNLLGEMILAAIAVTSLVYVGFKSLDWAVTRIIVSNQRVMELGGFIDTRAYFMPKGKLTDIRLDQNLRGHIFGYGRINVETAGQNQALSTINFLCKPQAFLRRLGPS